MELDVDTHTPTYRAAQAESEKRGLTHDQRHAQRGQILHWLREAGPRGISKAWLTFDQRLTQCGARVSEINDALEKEGREVIWSESRPGSKYVWFVLGPKENAPKDWHRRRRKSKRADSQQPAPPQTLNDSPDWYVATTGNPRPPLRRKAELKGQPPAEGLFDSVSPR
jgi:hypothetical protein